jgi:hypothetical protein
MTKKDLSAYKRKYQSFRHHAWAGLGFITVFMALLVIFPKFSQILTPIIFILIIYVVVALIFTYRYRTGLAAEEKIIQIEPSQEIEKEKIKADVEKEKIKLEKKKAKAKLKEKKKSK